MNSKMLQDGYICEETVIFGGLHHGGYVAKGYSVGLPTLTGSSIGYRNELEGRLSAMLRSLDSGARLQVRWSTDSDFGRELVAFHERTELLQPAVWSSRMRSERVGRYLERSQNGSMRKERVSFFVTRPMHKKPTANERALRDRAAEAGKSFDIFESVARENLAAVGGSVAVMGEDELAEEYRRFINPLHRGPIPFQGDRSILQNFQLGDGVGVVQPSIGFYLGGTYFATITLQSLPQSTFGGIVQTLTSLPICDFSICANIIPLVASEVIAKEEAEMAKLQRALGSRRHPRMEAALGVRQQRLTNLVGCAVVPFRCQFILLVWDSSMEGLQGKVSSLMAAVLRMQSAKPYEAAFPTTAVNFFRCCTPGWSFDSYRDHEHYLEDRPLADLLPFSGSSDPSLGTAEALYDDGSGGLIGVSGFSGEPGSESPRHTLVIGKTGSGKSLFVNDLLTQSDPHYDFTVIVDDGNSYGGLVSAMGGSSFIIEAHGSHTFNYLDPQGALTSGHLADVSAILLAMCGSGTTGRRASLLIGAVKAFYADVASDWLGGEGRIATASREAILFEEFSKMRPGGPAGAWADYTAAKLSDLLGFSDKLAAITDQEVEVFSVGQNVETLLRRLAFSLMKPEEMPTHSDFCQFLEVLALSANSEKEELDALAQDLRRWDREGPFGALFDGVGNFDFSGSLVHLELGRIPEAAKDLRRVALLLVCNQVRNEMMRRPRSQRKRMIVEEMSSLLEIPDAERVVRGFSDRGRKYGVWIIGVIQQLGERTKSPAFVSIIGNFRQIVLFKQTSAAEASVLADAFQLPDSARELLLSIPNPTKERGSVFLLCTSDEGRPVVRVGCNVVHPEMMFIAGSSGDQHERREAAIASGLDLLEAAASGT